MLGEMPYFFSLHLCKTAIKSDEAFKCCSVFKPLLWWSHPKEDPGWQGPGLGDWRQHQPGCTTHTFAPLIASTSSLSPRPWGQQQSGRPRRALGSNTRSKTTQLSLQNEWVRGGGKLKKRKEKNKDDVAWQREGRSSCAAGWAGTQAAGWPISTLHLMHFEPRSPSNSLCMPGCCALPLLSSCFSPSRKALLFALITHSLLLQAAITLVPRGAARTFKKISCNKGF